MAAPTIVNSNPTQNGNTAQDPSRKGSVTVAPGAYSNMPNGGHSHSASRPNINFGALNAPADSSPALAHSTPNTGSANLSHPAADAHVRAPAKSPSPIPQPAASGGRPPSGLPSQGNPNLVFGDHGDHSGQAPQMPQGPATAASNQSPAHFRRASSQSQHSDMGGRGGFMGQGGRGGRQSNQGYPQQMYSPAQGYRPMPGHQQRPGSIPPQFQSQMGPFPGSPHAGPPRSPGMSGSQPGTPQMQHMAMNQGPYQNQYAHYGGAPHFGQQAPYDPNFPYYQQPYGMPGHPQYMHGAPPSPRQFQQAPPTQRQSYIQGTYQTAVPPVMSRNSSQMSERPPSSLSTGPQHSGTPSHPSHTPSQSASAIVPPPAALPFTLPKKSKGIVIKNDQGEVVTFDKQKAAPPKAPSPAPSSSAAPTPPPRTESAASHKRTESKSGKTPEEIKAEFQAQVKRNQMSQQQRVEEENEKASDRADDAAASSTTAEVEKAKAASEQATADVETNADEAEPEQVQKPSVTETEVLKETPKETAKETLKETVKEAPKDTPKDATKETPQEAEVSAVPQAKEETEEERKKREDDEMEKMIAELEAKEKEDEERERQYKAKKQAEAAARKAKEAEEAANADEEMKRLEREAEAAEEAREKGTSNDPQKEEDAKLFASLKKSALGPQDDASVSEDAMPPPPVPQKGSAGAKPKPAALKLETAKQVEPAQPTPGMRSLRSARMLQLQSESVSYPEGIASPNPALNQSGKRNGRVYDTGFLLQFKEAFKEKPSVDWDVSLKAIVGDNDGSKSARTPVSSRQGSHRGGGSQGGAFGPMGSFQGPGGRTLPAGTTSEQRFQASQSGRGTSMTNPLAQYAGMRPGAFPMGSMGMGGRQPSVQGSRGGPRHGSQRGSQRGPSKKEQDHQNKSMPLTANMDIKPIEVSGSGWKPMSLSSKPAAATESNGHLPPDMVQRKVKAALNKMTPERFDKIADQIMIIAGQSKEENDGRSLRQVIALTFEKACDEAHWASMYAKFCKRMLEEMSPEIHDENVTDKGGNPVVGGPLFRKYLLNRCQEEFERGWEINLPEKPEGQTEVMLSDEYYIAAAAKRKGLGLIQFIGELYKLGMLSIRIMHECVTKLLDFEGEADEAGIESLVKLLRTVGATMENSEQGPGLVKTYFDRIDKIMEGGLPSRLHFMLLDTVELRRKGWKSKDDAKGPKTIAEIREEAAAAQAQAELDKARQSSRGTGGRPQQGRGDARNFSGPPPDYNRNTIGTDELRKLGQKNASRNSGAPRGLGPTSMFPSRSGSGRPGLGPLNRGDSGSNSRAGSQRGEKKEDDKTSANAFSALAALGGDESTDKTPSTSPSLTKATPATAQSEQSGDQA